MSSNRMGQGGDGGDDPKRLGDKDNKRSVMKEQKSFTHKLPEGQLQYKEKSSNANVTSTTNVGKGLQGGQARVQTAQYNRTTSSTSANPLVRTLQTGRDAETNPAGEKGEANKTGLGLGKKGRR